MKIEEDRSVQQLNTDKPAAVAVAHTWVGFLTVVLGAVAWVAGAAVAAFKYGTGMLLASALFPPVAWILWAAQLMGLTQ